MWKGGLRTKKALLRIQSYAPLNFRRFVGINRIRIFYNIFL